MALVVVNNTIKVAIPPGESCHMPLNEMFRVDFALESILYIYIYVYLYRIQIYIYIYIYIYLSE